MNLNDDVFWPLQGLRGILADQSIMPECFQYLPPPMIQVYEKTLTFPYLLAFDRCRTKKKISRSFWDPRPFFLRLALTSVGGIFNLVQAVSSYFNLISFFWLPAKAQVLGGKDVMTDVCETFQCFCSIFILRPWNNNAVFLPQKCVTVQKMQF